MMLGTTKAKFYIFNGTIRLNFSL